MSKVRSSSAPVNAKTTATIQETLTFGQGNSKLDRHIDTFSLPAGWSCPAAAKCLARTDPLTGRVKDGSQTEFRCFSASDEQIRPSVRRARWHNFELLRHQSRKGMANLLLKSLPTLARIVRVHISGDFFSRDYLDAWLDVARARSEVKVYFYTKSLRYWVNRLHVVGDGHTPGELPNVVPTASWGGKDDHLIPDYGLRSARVVLSEAEAVAEGLPLDHDDSHAMSHGGDFALLIHGMQPARTPAAKAISALRARGEFGYGRRANVRRLALPVIG